MSPRVGALLAPALAVGSGLAVLLAHPPVGWWPTSFLAPALLLAALLTDDRRARARGRRPRAGRLGALAGAATFVPLLSWLIMPAGYIGWLLLALIQAAWFGLLAVLLRPCLQRPVVLPIVTALAWTGVDAWRAIVPLGGFEWGAIAYAHAQGSWLLPVARLVGARGVTLLVVLISAAAFVVVRSALAARREGATVEASLATTRTPALLLVGALIVSALATIEPPAVTGSLDTLIVQGNDLRIDDYPADDPSFTITTQMLAETVRAVGDGPQPELTVWPEASADTDPYSPRGARFLPLLEEAAVTAGGVLAGVNLDGPDPDTGFYRTQLLLDEDAEPVDRYDKRGVVPFGEYIPYRDYLDWFPPLDQIQRDILPAPAPSLIELGDVPVAVLICFETLFTDIARSNVLAGDEPAQVLVAATTDASFGMSAEPAQHLAQSQLRAVETGRWVVHGALSGSSAFVDPDGGVHQATELFTIDSIRREVPLVEGLTPYLVTGDVLGWITRAAVVLLGLLALVTARRRRRAVGTDREPRPNS